MEISGTVTSLFDPGKGCLEFIRGPFDDDGFRRQEISTDKILLRTDDDARAIAQRKRLETSCEADLEIIPTLVVAI